MVIETSNEAGRQMYIRDEGESIEAAGEAIGAKVIRTTYQDTEGTRRSDTWGMEFQSAKKYYAPQRALEKPRTTAPIRDPEPISFARGLRVYAGGSKKQRRGRRGRSI